MKELGSLLKIQLNVNFGISAIKYKYFKQKKELWQPIIFLIAMLSLLPLYIGYIKLLGGVFSSLKSINQEGTILLVGVLGSQIILFIFGISHIFAKFYYADDLQILIPLPIKPSTILTARFITVLINEYLTILPIILPILLVYGIKSGLGILYWIYSILIIIAIPVIPLALSSIVVMIFMRYTNIKGKRDLIRVIGGVLMVLIILSVQVITQKTATTLPQGGEMEYIARLLSEKNSLIRQMGVSFPPSIWASTALVEFNNINGLLSLLTFVGISGLIFYGMVYISEKVFYKGLIGGQEVSSKKKKLTDKQFSNQIEKVRHPIFAILERDIKILVRTPIFLMNSIGAVIIIPFALAIPIFTTDPQMLSTITQFYKEIDTTIINLILSAFIMFIAANNGIGATTFSREGRQFWISRVIPIKVEDQLMGKILSSILVQVLALVIILGGALFVVPLKLSTILIVTILGLLGGIPITELAMLIDISRPLLDWDNPQKAMKQNMNVFFALLLGMAYLVVNVLLVLFMFKIKMNSLMIYLSLVVIYIVISIVLFKVLSSFTTKRFREIE